MSEDEEIRKRRREKFLEKMSNTFIIITIKQLTINVFPNIQLRII